ncbi:hypothetical protein HDV04_000296 [Boothiomyces sp. JEL0838]|nr:hypothetical protein HDV04_000296 [Boothiomyces sp. JEL0838]
MAQIQPPTTDLIYHIYRTSLFSRDSKITTSDKTEQLFHIEFPFSFIGGWNITFHWGADKEGMVALQIKKPVFNWSMEITDHIANYKTIVIPTGMFKKKFVFHGPDGKEYAWKPCGMGDLKLLSYPEKTQVALYDRKFAISKKGTLTVSPTVYQMANMIIATAFAVEEWERDQAAKRSNEQERQRRIRAQRRHH